MKRKRYDMIMNIPAPYRLHLFKEMHDQLAERGIDFHVHFMNRGHKDRPKSWLNPKIDVPHTFWRNWGTDQHEFNPGLILKLIFNPPEWLDLGSPYDTFTCIFLALCCRAKHVVMGLEGNTKTPGKMDGFIGWFKRFIMVRASNFYTPGSDGIKFFDMHRSRSRKELAPCALLPNVIEESRFNTRDGFERLGKNADIEQVRKSVYGATDDDRVVIIPARLEPVKGLAPFIEKLTPEMLFGWKLVVMGQGPLKEELLCLIDRRGLSGFVMILDYVAYDRMPLYYAAADMALLPSLYDPNPLTSIESLHSGLPLALSCMAGNVEEAVTEGKNGWVLPVNDNDMFATKLGEIFKTPLSELKKMGRVSKLENAQYWNTKRAVKKLFDDMGV